LKAVFSNYTFGSRTWALQNWGDWHISSNSSRYATGIESMTQRAQERFNAFVFAFFTWAGDATNPRTFPSEAGMCSRGVIRLRSHLMGQVQYACSYAVQGDPQNGGGSICGADFRKDYIGDVGTMSSELFELTSVDPGKEALYSRSSRQPTQDGNTRLKAHRGDAQAPKVPPPIFPSPFLPALCALYRDDFCCLGFSTPKECDDICSKPADKYRKMENWVVQPYRAVGVATEVAPFIKMSSALAYKRGIGQLVRNVASERIVAKEERFPRWDEHFDLFEMYSKRTGSSSIPFSYEENGIKLGLWLRSVKKLAAKGNLPEEKVRQLASAGVVSERPSPHASNWSEMTTTEKKNWIHGIHRRGKRRIGDTAAVRDV
jgi:hypothetical protein